MATASEIYPTQDECGHCFNLDEVDELKRAILLIAGNQTIQLCMDNGKYYSALECLAEIGASLHVAKLNDGGETCSRCGGEVS